MLSGVAWSGLTISGLIQMINGVKDASLPMILKLYAVVVSIWQSSFAVRSGLVYQAFGFSIGNLVVATCTVSLFLLCAGSLLSTARIRKLSLRKISQVDIDIVERCDEQQSTADNGGQ